MCAAFSPPEFLAQETEASCAIACLRMAASGFGIHMDEASLRQLCCTTERGTVIDDLCKGAIALGLEARVSTLQLDEVNPDDQLVISYLDRFPLDGVPTTHAVLITGVGDEVTCLDPKFGKRALPRDLFRGSWRGTRGLALVITGRKAER